MRATVIFACILLVARAHCAVSSSTATLTPRPGRLCRGKGIRARQYGGDDTGPDHVYEPGGGADEAAGDEAKPAATSEPEPAETQTGGGAGPTLTDAPAEPAGPTNGSSPQATKTVTVTQQKTLWATKTVPAKTTQTVVVEVEATVPNKDLNNFHEQCGSCTMHSCVRPGNHGWMLQCECRMPHGDKSILTMAYLNARLGNRDGQFVWGSARYWDSCTNFYLRYNPLQWEGHPKLIYEGDCKRRNGAWTRTEIVLSDYLYAMDGQIIMK